MHKKYRTNIKFILLMGCLSMLAAAVISGCKSDMGEFAVKRLQDDSFKRVQTRLYVDESEEVKWAYVFKKPQKNRDIGILIQKKEIGWVDVVFRDDIVGIEKNSLHGVISELPEGDYRLMLLDLQDNGRTISELQFTVYTDSYNPYE